MRNLAVAMLIMGTVFGIVAMGLMLRDASVASGIPTLIPAMFLLIAGVRALIETRA